MNTCNDPAISAQFRPLIGIAQRVFSFPKPGEVFGCYKTESSQQSSACMLNGLKSMAMHTLLFEGSNHTFNNSVLFRAVWRDEFLLQAIAGRS